MRPPRRLPSLLAAVVLLGLLPLPAAAKKTLGAPPPPYFGPIPTQQIGPSFIGAPACSVGARFRTPTESNYYFEPPDDFFFMLLDPAECPECTDGLILQFAHFVLEFRARCVQPVEMTILRSLPGPCPKPDLASPPICGPIGYNLTQDRLGVIDYRLSMPADCCINEKAFLCFRINSLGVGCDDTNGPMVVWDADGPCDPCRSYNYYTDNVTGDQVKDDICTVTTGIPPVPAFSGPLTQYAEAACCTSVPTIPTSWGSLKIRYSTP